MLLNILLLVGGLVMLIYAAEALVKGASSLAVRMHVPNMVIGLTIVAIGTSAPELVVNIISSIKGQSDLVFGNIMGSNIFNILCVLGITAIVLPIGIGRNTVKIEIPLVALSALFVLLLYGNSYNVGIFSISRIEGIILLFCFMAFMGYTLYLAKNQEEQNVEIKSYGSAKSIIFVVIGLAGLVIGGRLLVTGAVAIAQYLGVSERIIAITIVSIGTSLPELATSLVAVRRNNLDMAVGNVVGSNLINVFLILGISAVISPVELTSENFIDILVNITASVLLFIFIFTGKDRKIERWEGILLFSTYVAYLIYLIAN